MKTALTQLIEKLDEEINFILDNDQIEDRYYQRGLKIAKSLAQSYLEKEQNQIINCFQDGLDYNSEFITSSEYFNEKFND